MSACARVPRSALPRLARWRARGDVRAVVDGEAAWVFWPEAAGGVAAHVLSLPGAALAYGRDGEWRRLGASLPVFGVPDPREAVPLERLLFPDAVRPRAASGLGLVPVPVRLVSDDSPRRATALRISLAALAAWADVALSDDIEAVEAAVAGNDALLRGRLPPLAGERFWGRQLLVLAGFRPDPLLPEAALSEAAGLGDDVGLFTPAGLEVVPQAAFAPLTRAGARLAARAAP